MSTNNIVGSIQTQVNITEEMVSDIMVGAIEGGINYWGYVLASSKVGKPKDMPTSEWCTKKIIEGGFIEIGDVEDDDVVERLDLPKFIKGCQQHAERREFNLDQMDAEDYDCIIQIAIFGEVTYG